MPCSVRRKVLPGPQLYQAIASALRGLVLLALACPGKLTTSRLQLLELAVRFSPGAATALVEDARSMDALFSLDEGIVPAEVDSSRWALLTHILCQLEHSGLRLALITRMLRLLAQSQRPLNSAAVVFLSHLAKVDDDAANDAAGAAADARDLQAAAGACAVSLAARVQAREAGCLAAAESLLRGPDILHDMIVASLESPLLDALPAGGSDDAMRLLELLSRIGEPTQNPHRLRTLMALLSGAPDDFGSADSTTGSDLACRAITVLTLEFECAASNVAAALNMLLDLLRQTRKHRQLCPAVTSALEKMAQAAVATAPRVANNPLEDPAMWRFVYINVLIQTVGLDFVSVDTHLAHFIQLYLTNQTAWWIPSLLLRLEPASQLSFALTLLARLNPGEPVESQFHAYPMLASLIIKALLGAAPGSPVQQRIIAALAIMTTKRLVAAHGTAPFAVKAVRLVVPGVLERPAAQAGQQTPHDAPLFYGTLPQVNKEDDDFFVCESEPPFFQERTH